MKQSIGIDIVHVKRFEKWAYWSDKKLARVFTSAEIQYAKSNMLFCAQRLAVRFAAKEAFLKAFQELFPHNKVSLLNIFKAISVGKKMAGNPYLIIQYNTLLLEKSLESSLSLSHSGCCAVAVVQLRNG